MKNTNLYLKDFFKNQVKPKLEDEDEIAKFEIMAAAMDAIGVDSYHSTPEQILEELEDAGYKDHGEAKKLSEQEWLNFISHKSISTFLEQELIKINRVILRQKIVLAASTSASTSDIKLIGILKDMIASSDTNDDSVIHYSQSIPLREGATDNSEGENHKNMKEDFMNLVGLLEIDTDYMNIVDAQKAKQIEEEKFKKYQELDKLAEIVKEINDESDEEAQLEEQENLFKELEGIDD